MNLALSSEQQLLKDSFQRFFSKESSIERVRAAAPLGFDANLWSALLEMQAPLARVPAAHGGLDMSLLDAAIIAEEAGRALACAPLVEVMVAARALALAGKEGAGWIHRIARGAIVVPALHRARGGALQEVPGGAVADAVVALDGDELVLLSRANRGGLQINIGQVPVACWNLRNESLSRTVLARGDAARAAAEMMLAEWKLLSAATLAGLSRQALDLAAAYAKERIQFGRPVGSFQGLAHPLADAVTQVDGGRLLVWKAIWSTAHAKPDAAALISLAWWWMGQASVIATRRALRAFGGYGLSLEYDVHWYHRRVAALILLGGDPQRELETAGELLFAGRRWHLPEAGEVGISFDLNEAALRHMENARAFFAAHWDDRMRAKAHHSTASHDAEFHRKLAEAGLIFSQWPVEHGGAATTAAVDYVVGEVCEEWNYTSHVAVITNIVAHVLMKFGSSRAKAEILPRIKAGEAVCSLGFSEPASGSDVFAAQTTAVREGEEWIINGQKMFTTAGHCADYVLLLARTSSGGSKHGGLTLFIVPTNQPGFAVQPVHTYQDERTNITFYSNVRVPDAYRLGPVDGGAAVMAAALSLEHGGVNYFSGQTRMLRSALAWAEARDAEGVRPLDDKSIRTRLARIRARYEVASCFVARGIWAADADCGERAWGPMAKVFITESFLESSWEILEMGGSASIVTGNHPLGLVELDHRRAYGTTIYGGTSEIHRSIIAEQALGLPKSRS